MELLSSSLTAAMELMDSLTFETCFWLSWFNSQTLLILSAMEASELIVLVELCTLFCEAVFIFSTKELMLCVSFCVSPASSLISFATTAKLLPASPARAASTEAFSASRFVCRDILSIPAMTVIKLSITSTSSSISCCISRETAIVWLESSLMFVSSPCPASIFL